MDEQFLVVLPDDTSSEPRDARAEALVLSLCRGRHVAETEVLSLLAWYDDIALANELIDMVIDGSLRIDGMVEGVPAFIAVEREADDEVHTSAEDRTSAPQS